MNCQRSYMKKKSDIFEHKKFKPRNPKTKSRLFTESNYDYDKSLKTRSSDKKKNMEYPSQRFKVNTKGPYDQYQSKCLRTEGEDSVYRPKYHFQALKRQEKNNKMHGLANQTKKNDSTHYNRNFSQIDKKNKTLKKLHLNQQFMKMINDGSLQKHEGPLSGKNYQSFRRPHQSHRSVHKKTAIQDYVSNSLENLKPKKSLLKVEPKTSLKKEKQLTLNSMKPNKLLICEEDATQELKKRSREKSRERVDNARPIERNTSKKNNSERDQSLQKFQIKFEKSNKYDLSREESEQFGDRFPDGFDKVKLLGRGGFSLVWLGEHKKSRKQYAVKQIITESTHQTHIKEIWFGTYFFEFGGAAKQQFAQHPGIKNLVKLYYYFINKKDTWILYEKCGDSLGNTLYDLKGERLNNEKLYRIHYKPLYERIRKNQNQLRKIILEVAKALQLLAENNIVHSDLKTENILVREKTVEEQANDAVEPELTIAQAKLIDYGSSFVFNNLRQFSMATPEYMAPEILNFILYENDLEYIHKLLDYVQKYTKPWVIDIWSLGCVILEIISGVPLWMSLKTIVRKPGESTEHIRYGLFAVKGRLFDKIIRKQIEVIQSIDHYLYDQNYSGIILEDDLKSLLKKMLALNPSKRISPSEIIEIMEQALSATQRIENKSSSRAKQEKITEKVTVHRQKVSSNHL